MKQDDTGMCWHCNAVYSIDAEKCPKCNATNPNQDYDKALAEALEVREIEEMKP